ncbi:hypothetical protein BC332_27132 [Capsicum chinense]|nr:hypothetical protein BC332_27132 [Capsicum chinense]
MDDTVKTKGEVELEDMLQKCLKRKRYLIVLDDIWSCGVWDGVIRCFSTEDSAGSRILLTTRNDEVACYAGVENLSLRMSFMDQDESWSLFKSAAFSSEALPYEFETVGKQIADECHGLPLTIVVVAGLLKSKRAIEDWKSVAKDVKSFLTNDLDEQCSRVLGLSYNHLTSDLKTCLLHFGIFPEDSKIPAKNLMRSWMAEGFLKLENDLEGEAEKCLALLTPVNRQLGHHENNDLLKRTRSIFSFHLQDSYYDILKFELIHFKLLKVLELRHRVIGNFPVQILSLIWLRELLPASAKVFPSTLQKLKLENTFLHWSYMDIIAELPNLEVLMLMRFACDGKEWHPNVREFTRLKLIELPRCLPELGESAARIQKEQEDLGNNPVDVRISIPFDCYHSALLFSISSIERFQVITAKANVNIVDMAHASVESLTRTIESLLTFDSPMQSLIYDHREEFCTLHEKVISLEVFVKNFEKNNVSGEMTDFEVEVKEVTNAVEYTIQLRLTETLLSLGLKSQKKKAHRRFRQSLQQVAEDIDRIWKESTKIQDKGKEASKESTIQEFTSSSKDIQNVENSMVGRDDQRKRLVEDLTRSYSGEPKVIPIVGIGGIGKTTLANEVYNDACIRSHFDVCAWATVSQQHNVKEILLSLLRSTKAGTINMNDEAELANMLQKSLKGKRYLIVLDDMWKSKAWGAVRLRFLSENKGSEYC